MGSTEVLSRTLSSEAIEDEENDEISVGCADTFTDPTRGGHRFIALILMCLIGFGSYFCYDNPAALQDAFIDDMTLSTTEFVYLYSWYSWPNIVLCFIGGFLLDRVFGIQYGTVFYTTLVVIGQLIFAAGAFTNKFWLTVFGRFIFGIGGESLAVAQNTYAVLWFKGRELNMVFGLQLSFARVGSSVNFYVMEPLYAFVNRYFHGHECLGIVLTIACCSCAMSMLCAIILGWMDKRAEKALKRNENKSDEVVHLTDVKDFTFVFWLIAAICVLYYVAIFPFIALGKVFFMKKYEMNAVDANWVNGILYLISAVASPLLGLMVDKVGYNVFWVFVSIVMTIVCHAFLAFTFYNPLNIMIMMGVSYSLLASALWPMIAFIIPEYQLGTAYGMAQALQNGGLAISILGAGMIVDSSGYFVLELFFLICLFFALVVTIIIWLYDGSKKNILNMSATERLIYERERMAADLLEREKLLASSSGVSPYDLLQPHSDFHIRNRYLSRIGANLPSHLASHNKGLAYRGLR
ncbi:major facilitator superfamily domain-containing protein 1 [Nilaparvata lugens]|uniref:major facilitator superfamily domain-containing protein 1 n=1 Tax=Nilaparvata lugens TaxID=108931 RepID=UPI000B98FBB1|nr:major facilitator superfamily domain-containing protein 1 [Nilaparvata lugens]